MTAGEFNKRQLQKSIALLLEEEPKTQRERDIFNLKQIRYSIRHGSDWYRYGVIARLDRVIKMLEEGDLRRSTLRRTDNNSGRIAY